MSLLQTVRLLSGERLDLQDFKNLQNFICSEFGAIHTYVWSQNNYVMNGFDSSGVGTSQLDVVIANSTCMIGENGGVLFIGAPSLSNLSTDNLTPASTNYVEIYIDEDTGAADSRAFWDQTANGGVGAEFSQIIDTYTFIKANLNINDASFTGDANKVAICEVDVNAGGVITEIRDARNMFFRLGRAGDVTFDYAWGSRTEPVDTQFTGADKDIDTMKEMFDALMSSHKEIKGTTYWYEIPGVSLIGGFRNIGLSVLTGSNASARFKWSGTDLLITDDAGSPADADVLAHLRLLDSTANLNLTRQEGANSIAISDGEVVWVEIPDPLANTTYDGIGATSLNYRVTARGSVPTDDTTYWLAFREGTKLYLRGLGELEAGEERQINDETSTALASFLGFDPEIATTVPYGELPDSSYLDHTFTTSDHLVEAITVNTQNINDTVIAKDTLQQIFPHVANKKISEELMRSIDSDLTIPLRLDASSTPDLVVTVSSGTTISNAESDRQRRTGPIGSIYPEYSSGETITFPAASGGNIVFSQGNNSVLTLTNNNYIKGLIYLDVSDNLNIILGTENTVEADAVSPVAPENTLPVGIVTLFNNAGTINNITQEKIVQFGSGIGSGGTSTADGDGFDLNTLNYYVNQDDTFSDTDLVDLTASNAVSSALNQNFVIEYDATKTLTVATNNVTIGGAPAFTVAVGDIIQSVDGTKHTKISTVNSQQDFDVEDGSVLSSGSVGLISQMVQLKELTSYGDADYRVEDQFDLSSEQLDEALVLYLDSAVEKPGVDPDVSYSACSNSTITTPSNWSVTSTRREGLAEQADSVVIPNASNKMYARFFANKTSGSGTVTLDEVDIFYIPRLNEASFVQSWAAYAYDASANSWSEQGSGSPSLSLGGGDTELELGFIFDRFRATGSAKSQLFVMVNGNEVFQEVGSLITGRYSYTIIDNHTIRFNEDLTQGDTVTDDIEVVVYLMDAGSVDVASLSERIGLLETPEVIIKTSDYTLTADDVDGLKTFTNEGAGGTVKFTLPSAVAAYKVTFINVAGQRIEIAAASGDDINSTTFTGIEEIYSETFGETMTIRAANSTNWFIEPLEVWTDTAARAIFGGGQIGTTAQNVMDYITIAILGNASDFGDLTAAKQNPGTCASSTRGIIASGSLQGGTATLTIDYITIATTGNATNFGNSTQARDGSAGCSSETRGLFHGGYTGPIRNTIDYVTIASTGNASDFGDVTISRTKGGGSASTTRGLFSGGDNAAGSYYNTIDYVTIATTGNSTDFGDLILQKSFLDSCSSSTRSVTAGGFFGSSQNVIEYITIVTTGNGTDFGDLTAAVRDLAAASSKIRGVFAGGNTGSEVNTIDYITLASAGNASDFGDLTVARDQLSGLSNGHGGL